VEPLVFVHGSWGNHHNWDMVAGEFIDKLMNAIPHAKRITIEGAGHVPHMSHSKKYIEQVSNFCLEVATI
jgi:pimeloyl-ACP methyl ester carboxylesterase